MAFIKTIAPEDAAGEVLEMYARQQGKYGYVPNYARVFCYRPEIMTLWAKLLSGIRRHIAPKQFELATLSTAHSLKNSACALAHGQALSRICSKEDVIALLEDVDSSALAHADKAIVKYARKAALDASSITAADIDVLRQAGLGEDEIFDVAVTVAARAFFATLLDALGVEPDSSMLDLDAELRERLTVGRPISVAAPESLPRQ